MSENIANLGKDLGPSFPKLAERWADVTGLQAAASLMYWDQSTYLPEKASGPRGDHLSAITKVSHELSTADDIAQWYKEIAPYAAKLSADSDAANLIRVARKDYERAKKVPAEFSARRSKLASESYDLWKKARAANDFSIVQDVLERNLELSREEAGYLKEPGQTSLMDPLIESSDPGFTEAMIRPLFADLRARLVPLLKKITEQKPFNTDCLMGDFPENLQLEFGEAVIRELGFDFGRGRQDLTEHPFMTRFSTSDVRITTRAKRDDVSDSFFSTVHEAGHALYELGIDPRYDGTALGGGSSSGIHESQSRLWENLVARSLPFWEHFFPKLQEKFPQLKSTDVKTFHRAINKVERSLIRTDADEVTYNLHVMIRFDLECDLIAGRLAVKDLPEAWNARYKSDLGLTPPTAAQGVLQDVHWFHGGIGGAFQGYTIGNILSAQLFAAAQRAHPELESEFRNGKFTTLREWLRVNLHQYGRKFDGPELIKRATGKALGMDAYFNYLESKYQALLG